jgi:hypothetical protein
LSMAEAIWFSKSLFYKAPKPDLWIQTQSLLYPAYQIQHQ